jgi:Flp pilus assembly pilin Flp
MGGFEMLRSLLVEERGTETVEWGLMAGLIVGGLILTLIAVGLWLSSRMESLQTELGA